MQFWIAQIIGIIVIILCTIMPHCKTRASMLLLNLFANVCLVMQFWILGAETGIASSISTIIRGIVLFLYARKEKVAPVYVLVGLIILHIAAISFAWQGVISIFVLFSIFNIYGLWQKNLQVARVSAIITSVGFVIYSIVSGAYTGAINELILICSASTALWRFRKREEKI